MLTVPTCGNNLWPNAVAGAQKFFLLINTMNDLLSISLSLSLAISSQFLCLCKYIISYTYIYIYS